MSEFETFDVAGLTVELHYDDDPPSPREWDNLSRFISWDRDIAGDENYRPDYIYDNAETIAELREDHPVVVPVFAETRGGQGRIYETSDDHASGAFVVTPKALKAEGCSLDDAKRIVAGEIDAMSDYFGGEVFGFVVKDETGETLDSCWGFYGREYVEQEARDSAQYFAEQAKIEACRAAYWASRDVETGQHG